MKKFLLLLIIASFLLGNALESRFKIIKNRKQPETIDKIKEKLGIPVEVCNPVFKESMQKKMEFYGTIVPFQTTTISAQINEQIIQSKLSLGKKVKKGDVLVLLSDSMLKAQVDLASASLRQAESTLKKLQSGSRPQEIKQAQASLKSAQAQFNNAEEELKRMENLKKSGAIPPQKADAIIAHHRSAKAGLDAAIQQLSLVKEGARIEDLMSAKAIVEQAESRLHQTELQKSYTEIQSPFDGFISEIFREKGEMFPMQSKTLFTIVDLSQVYLEAEVSELYINQIQSGVTVECTSHNLPGKSFYGKIDEISPSSLPGTRFYQVRILISNPNFILKPGMFFKTEIVLEEKKHVLAVHKECLFERNNQSCIYIVNENKVILLPVKKGIFDKGYVELLDFQEKNAQIVFKGQNSLSNGSLIRTGGKS